MKQDDESKWLCDRMEKLRESRNASAPAFEQIWRAARAQHAGREEPVAWSPWRLAGISIAAIFVIAGAAFWTASEREHNRRVEAEFAAVDGALLTYWQAPSDDLVPVGTWNESPEP